MRVRPSHIVVAILALIGVFFVFAYVRMNGASGVAKSSDFLDEARARRESGRGSSSSDGIIHGGSKIGTGAKIEVETDHFDMGEVSNTGPTTKEVLVFNRGDAPLEITEIRTTCACTVGKLNLNSKKENGAPVTVIPPGGSLPMSVVVDPFRIPGFDSTKILTLYSNDPANPAQEVAVTAKVKPEFILEPDTLDFGKVENGSVLEAKILLRESDAPDLDITGLRPARSTSHDSEAGTTGLETEKYTLDLKKRAKEEWRSPDHAEWEITVRLAPDLPAGDFHDSFVILSNIKRVDAIGYKIAATIDSFFSVAPTMLSVRNAVDPGKDKVATAVVSSDAEFSVEDLDVSGDAFTVQTRPGDQPHTLFIDLGVRPDAAPGLKNERISFTVRSGEKSVKHTMRAFASVTG